MPGPVSSCWRNNDKGDQVSVRIGPWCPEASAACPELTSLLWIKNGTSYVPFLQESGDQSFGPPSVLWGLDEKSQLRKAWLAQHLAHNSCSTHTGTNIEVPQVPQMEFPSSRGIPFTPRRIQGQVQRRWAPEWQPAMPLSCRDTALHQWPGWQIASIASLLCDLTSYFISLILLPCLSPQRSDELMCVRVLAQCLGHTKVLDYLIALVSSSLFPLPSEEGQTAGFPRHATLQHTDIGGPPQGKLWPSGPQ